ncbi:hypothetical protein PoB_005932500 [Plakobranchus ocellatus]|uniref:Uncharacterized protein n=1 Tax=Plakobranchus ocellatus TaxID=259542 RepID=A0AAV4CLZ5_9GAST|nr:hypothetical protein PoB_005932500 [Plakobranchus ocellatus]
MTAFETRHRRWPYVVHENPRSPSCEQVKYNINHRSIYLSIWSVGGTVDRESAPGSSGALLSRVGALYQHPGLTEGLKA